MTKREIGSTGIFVSAIGLGAMPLSISGRPPEDEAMKVIHRALDRGVTLIDTADAYCIDEGDKHHNERIVARALHSWNGDRSKVVVATKGGLVRPQGRWDRCGDPDHLRGAIRRSHAALGGEKPIDLWQYHAPDPAFKVRDSLKAVAEAVTEGLIRHVGVSNFSVGEIDEARSVLPIVSVQNQYSLWDRSPEEDGVLEYCTREKLAFFPWSPLGGMRRAKGLSEFTELAEIATGRGVSCQQVVLAWLLAKSPVVIPIPGASRVSSVEDSVKAADLTLSGDEIRRLDEMEV